MEHYHHLIINLQEMTYTEVLQLLLLWDKTGKHMGYLGGTIPVSTEKALLENYPVVLATQTSCNLF